MKDLIIVGAGGYGCEAYYMARGINEIDHRWNIKGFINDISVDLKSKKIDLPILGTIKDWYPKSNEVFAIGISSPKGKEKVVSLLKSRGAVFVTMVSPRNTIAKTAEIGEGCVIPYPSIVKDCAKIGNFVHVCGSMVGRDCVIGDFSTTTGWSNLGACTLGKRVFVCSNAVVPDGIQVGDDAYLCAGSVVFQDVPPGERMFGNPAKKMEF